MTHKWVITKLSISVCQRKVTYISRQYCHPHIKTSVIIIIPNNTGCPWSSLSDGTAKIFDIFPLLHISSGATRPALSKYQSFYRVIPSDILQAQALMQLCLHYNLTHIGIVYINDVYGEGLRTAIEEEALAHNIDAKSISYENSTASMESVATFLKENDVHITILVVFDFHILRLFETLEKHHLVGNPYFYIGTDGWFSDTEIQKTGISKYIDGSIGTLPGTLSMISQELYKKIFNIIDGDMTIYHETMKKHNRIAEVMKNKYIIDEHDKSANYGHDATLAVVHALHIFNQNYSLDSMFDNCSYENLQDLQTKLRPVRDIMRDVIRRVRFIGATGQISFKENGDREGGVYLYGQWTKDKGMTIFGGKSDNGYFINSDINEWTPLNQNRSVEDTVISSTGGKEQGEIKKIHEVDDTLLTVICVGIGVVFLLIIAIIGASIVCRSSIKMISKQNRNYHVQAATADAEEGILQCNNYHSYKHTLHYIYIVQRKKKNMTMKHRKWIQQQQ